MLTGFDATLLTLALPDGPPSLDASAAAAVRAWEEHRLRKRDRATSLREPPLTLPELEEGWNQALVQAIRDFKNQFRSSGDLRELADLSGRMYGQSAHWALELLQNAEDEGARRLVLVFNPEDVTVINDGSRFSARDVWAICSAGASAKRNKIGFFGIGFKAVHQISDVQEVRSGPYAFRIEDHIYPSPLPLDRRARRHKGAYVRLLVPPDNPKKCAARDQALQDLTAPDFIHLLLTLESLESVRIIDNTGKGRSGRFTRRVLRSGDSWDEVEIAGTWEPCGTQRWRRHRFDSSDVPAGVTREGRTGGTSSSTRIVLARPADSQQVPGTQLHCFLPLNVPSELRWLVQADFEPTPGREQPVESDWNKWLFDQIGVAMATATATGVHLGFAPWPVIPRNAEVRHPLQQLAYRRAAAMLRSVNFVTTEQDLKTPPHTAWPELPAIGGIVRNRDLAAVTGRPCSYAATPEFQGIAGRDRAIGILRELGGVAIGCGHVLELLKQSDAVFQPETRGVAWWLRMLATMAEHATALEKLALASTACLPLRDGRRIRPSQQVSLDGYLVAFSRSESLGDVPSYFNDGDIHILLPDLVRPADKEVPTPETTAMRERVRGLLVDSITFRVASEAGPYHVVRDLILPRMKALGQLERLNDDQASLLWRMVEYVRDKWSSYISESRRLGSRLASEEEIAAKLGAEFRVVGEVYDASNRRWRKRATLVRTSYMSKAFLGRPAMEVVLRGRDGLTLVSEMHLKSLHAVPGRRQPATVQRLEPTTFLRSLGAPIGPTLTAWSAVHTVDPVETPWIDWPALLAGEPIWRSKGLENDRDSPDIAWLQQHWPALSESSRQERGRALLWAIQTDWARLRTDVNARAVYYNRKWRATPVGGTVPTTWVGRLRRLAWLSNQDRQLCTADALVLPTTANRWITGGNRAMLAAWEMTPPDAALALGVHAEPDAGTALETLSRLRDGQLIQSTDQINTIHMARACYALLAKLVSNATCVQRSRLVERLKPRFSGNQRVGLIYAPPPDGAAGDHVWWPASRCIQQEAWHTAGRFIGHQAKRYPQAAALWDALGVPRTLTPQLALELIRRDLIRSTADSEVVRHYYGQLVAFLNESAPDASPSDVPALTTRGWVSPGQAVWTSRPELQAAFEQIAWWTPGSLDPSDLSRAAHCLHIEELRPRSEGGRLQEQWMGTNGNVPETLVLDSTSAIMMLLANSEIAGR